MVGSCQSLDICWMASFLQLKEAQNHMIFHLAKNQWVPVINRFHEFINSGWPSQHMTSVLIIMITEFKVLLDFWTNKNITSNDSNHFASDCHLSATKNYMPGLHQHPGHKRHAQAICLSKSDLLELHWSQSMELTTPVQNSSGVLTNSRHSKPCHNNTWHSNTTSSVTNMLLNFIKPWGTVWLSFAESKKPPAKLQIPTRNMVGLRF